MKKATLYFLTPDSELCYPLPYHLSKAMEQGLKTIELYQAEPYEMKGMFWCKAMDTMGEQGECSRACTSYNPKNGKSGMCRQRSNVFYEATTKLTFEVKAF